MRTTLSIDDDVLSAARMLAAERRISLGEAVSILARSGLQPPAEPAYRGDFPVFDVREDAPLFGPEEVAAALDDSE